MPLPPPMILRLLLPSILLLQLRPALAPSVFPSGIGGFPCVRVPSLLAIPGGPLLAFAECRSFTGDGCEPRHRPSENRSSSDIKDRVVCMRSSSDAGSTWGPLLSNISRGRASYPTAVFEPKAKAVLLHFSAWPGDEPSSHVNYYHPSPMQVVSTDNGRTFSAPVLVFPSEAHNPPSLFLGSCRGTVVAAGPHAGRVLFAGYNHSLPKDTESHTFVWYSDLGGREGSWRRSPTGIRYMAEPQITTLPSTNEVALIGRSNGQMGCRCQNTARSSDGGVSWSQAHNLTSLPSPSCQGSVLMSRERPGDQQQILGFYSGPDSATARVNMTVWTTTDPDARLWQPVQRVASAPSQSGSYSCIEDLSVLAATSSSSTSAATGVLWETTLEQTSEANSQVETQECAGGGCNIVFKSF
jgi:hypothetical protein